MNCKVFEWAENLYQWLVCRLWHKHVTVQVSGVYDDPLSVQREIYFGPNLNPVVQPFDDLTRTYCLGETVSLCYEPDTRRVHQFYDNDGKLKEL